MDFLAFFFSGLFICEAERERKISIEVERGGKMFRNWWITNREERHIWIGQYPLVTEWISFFFFFFFV